MQRPIEGPAGTYRVFARLQTVDEALASFLSRVPGPRGAPERVGLDAALGRVLAAPVVAAGDVPPFDRSTVDGYAVRAADTAGAEPAQARVLRWQGEVRMGEAPRESLAPGAAMAVATGAALPPGADAVVMVEHTSRTGDGAIAVQREVRPGENVLRRGADVRAGAVVVPAGCRLRPQDVGAAAAAGAVELRVHPRPRVAVVVTGDELVPPHAEPGPGQIRDANGYSLAAALRVDGCVPRAAGRVADRPEALAAVLERLDDCDAVLVSGGSSVGTRDVTVDALRLLPDVEVLVHGIAVRPGKPTLLALARGGRQVVCGLPGNPVSALVIYEVFVRPALARLAGVDPLPAPPTVRARLAAAVRRPSEREDLVRVRLCLEADGWRAEPVPGGSGELRSLVWADGLVRIPWAREGYDAGEEVDVRILFAEWTCTPAGAGI